MRQIIELMALTLFAGSLILLGCGPGQLLGPTLTPTPTITPTSTFTSTPVPPTITPTLIPPTPTLIPLEFEFLGVPASYSKDQTHWKLVDLQLWHNRIYIAHGDWDLNTGPVRAIYYNLDSEKFIQDEGFKFSEEAIEKFHIYNDILYVPGTDATESWDFGNIYSKNWGGKWTKLRTIPNAVHVFDVAVLGKTLAASGSGDGQLNNGYIWISTNQGQTWQQSFPIVPVARSVYEPHIILFVLQNRFFAATPVDGCFVFDNETWVNISCLPHFHSLVDKHVLYQNVAVLIPYYDYGGGTQLFFFNGKDNWFVDFGSLIRDAVSTSEGLYVLVGSNSSFGSIFRASSIECHCEKDFTRIVDFDMAKEETDNPAGNYPLSLEYVNDRFYIGFADGRLYRSQPYVR